MLAVCCRTRIPWAAPSQSPAPVVSSTSRNRKMDWGGVWQVLAWFIQEIDGNSSFTEQQYHVVLTNSAGKTTEQFPCEACAM